MKAIFFTTIFFGAAIAVHVHAGTITGTVKAEGKKIAEDPAGGGAYADRKFKFVERINYSELKDFVVYIEGPVGEKPVVSDKTASIETRRIAQKDADFTPHVLPIVVGTKVEWPNNDQIQHNVFSISEAKQFDLGLYKGNPPEKSFVFEKTGQVDVFCSIHKNMHCIVLVLENPCFAVANESGRYSITNVPPGTYKLKAWHDRLPAQVKEVVVPKDGEVKVDFTLGINNLPKY